jgi:hypothetical protein
MGAAVEKSSETVFKPVTEKIQAGHYDDGTFEIPAEYQDIAIELEFRGAGTKIPGGKGNEWMRAVKLKLSGHVQRYVAGVPESGDLIYSELSYGFKDNIQTRSMMLSGWGTENTPGDNRDHFWPSVNSKNFTSSPLARPSMSPDPEQWHLWRIVRIGNQMETLMDGQRLALMPAPSPVRNLTLYIQFMGASMDVRAFRVHHLPDPTPGK